MTYHVEVTQPADADADDIYRYIAQRSPQGARSWWQAFLDSLGELRRGPANLMNAPESDAFDEPLYQLLFSTRRGNTYRALFVVREETVYVLRVRGFGQRLVLPDDIMPPE